MVNKDSNEEISGWHDLELVPSTLDERHVTGLIEISKGSSEKFELMKTMEMNPIMQDTKKDSSGNTILRNYGMPIIFNYGMIPQTWEDTLLGGDDDPLDIVDLGQSNKKPIFGVYDWLVLGSLGLIDQGEMDWKILAIEVNEAKRVGVNSVEDYRRLFPGAIGEVREWFRTYKTLEGKKENKFT